LADEVGRGALNWSVRDLAEKAGVGTATIVRYEKCQGVPRTRNDNLAKIISVLKRASIEFIGTPDEAPGIRIQNTGVDARE